ncbi:alpha/beta hydrolase [Fredinandcohnia sp. QZ13]|uniref:alpha/beta fold hydrolase n=1 Tax=Fredinandcohnia sp. QZ13 TaxID=3073144 RepID=UPI00285336AA|nr:alpha/beta hydrolase [Fredinandcohnia sp. QZ13]MDR4889379.1 alpha/beta hydrolase [Fredinandcohnia sp. QZ13]
MDTIQIKGIKLHYELYQQNKEKPVLVLLHGFLSSSFSFRRLIPVLSKNYTILSVDLPPFGKSEKSTRFTYSYSNIAWVVSELIRSFHFTKINLVGHSMGGQICLYIAKQTPSLVDKLVLLCSSGYMKRMPRSLIYSSYLPYFHFIVKKKLAKQGVLHNLRNVVHNHELIDQEMIDGYTEPFLDNRIFMGLTRMIRHREGDLSSEELKQIKHPVLLIWGEKDRVVPISVGKMLHQDLPHSTFVSIKNTGHLVPEECPEKVATYITKFI